MADNDHGHDDSNEFDRRTALKGGAAGLGLLALGGLGAGSAAASNGADKVFAAGSTHQVVADTNNTKDNWDTMPATLASGTIKTSSPTDLIIYAQMESALWTDVEVTSGGKGKDKDETSLAFAQVESWVEIDGTKVPVTTSEPDTGNVVVNNRKFKVETSFLEDIESMTEEEEYLRIWNQTRSTNGFNWVALNLGASDFYSASKNHTIELKAELSVNVDDDKAHAKAAVGPRTLIAVPAKLANDAEV